MFSINKITFYPVDVIRFAHELDVIANEAEVGNPSQAAREITKQFVGNFLASICDDARSLLFLAPALRRIIEEINDGNCEVYETNDQRIGIIHTGREFEVLTLREALKNGSPFLRLERGYYSFN